MKRLAIILIIIFTAIHAQAQNDKGILNGHVTDASGEALPGVNIIIMKNGQFLGAQSTSAYGNYEYDDMMPNTYDIVVSKKGMTFENNEIKNIVIEPAKITSVNIALNENGIASSEIKTIVDSKKIPQVIAIINVPKKDDNPKEEFKGQYYPFIPENDFVLVNTNPQSTFSADVDNAFYTIIRRMIAHRIEPPAGAVRIEEMLNYFEYNYPKPQNGDAFAIYSETAKCPWSPTHILVHIGIQGRDIMNDNLPPANLVFLLDVSGSMATSDKLPLVKSSMRTLVKQLRAKDKISIVTYADDATIIAENIPGSDKETLLKAIGKLQAEGSTAGAQGLQTAYSVAKKYFIKNGNNRIIIATDGDFNVGISTDEALLSFITEKRKTGIYLTALGFGMDNLQDGKLELLADKGNGNYGYIENEKDAEKMLVSEMGATLFAIAKDVKIQTQFNAQYAKAYRLIGYENRALTDNQFDKNKTDAGDIGAGKSVTALYEVIPVSESIASENNLTANTLMTVSIKYKEPVSATNSTNKEIKSAITYSNKNYTDASDNFRFAAAVAEFGLFIRDSKFKEEASIKQVIELAQEAKGLDKNNYREDFIKMVTDYGKMKKIVN